MSEKHVYYTGGGRCKMVGQVTGRIYWFPEGESILVDTKDIPDLLERVRITTCCGSKRRVEQPLFALK